MALKRERSLMQVAVMLAAVLGLIISRAECADENPGAPKTVHLLTIGNSFSQNATRHLGKLAAARGHKLIHRQVVVGGASMELHATKAARHDADAADPDGMYADGSSLQQRLSEQKWDVVTIQQASRLSPDVTTYQPFATQLRDQVRKHAPQATLMIHQTWAYREDDPWFVTPAADSTFPRTQLEMFEKLQAAYAQIARELEVNIIPVGAAFQLVTQDPQWHYTPDANFDATKLRYPELPEQLHSLHVGWRWREVGMNQKLQLDAHHANVAGEYLGGCVFYEILFEDDVRENSFAPDSIDPQFAKLLRESAHRVVAGQTASVK